eukprot:1991682-Rhodomonas_salina.1
MARTEAGLYVCMCLCVPWLVLRQLACVCVCVPSLVPWFQTASGKKLLRISRCGVLMWAVVSVSLDVCYAKSVPDMDYAPSVPTRSLGDVRYCHSLRCYGRCTVCSTETVSYTHLRDHETEADL